MKILILGGTSFFGREFAIKAFNEGNKVSVFSRKAPTDNLPLDIKQIRGDREFEPDLARLSIENWDIVFDNICYSPESAQKALKYFSGRVGLYIFTSSEAVYYLIRDLSNPFRENHTDIFKDNIEFKKGGFWDYASGKLKAEQIFLAAFREQKFPVSIIRLPIVIGPYDNTLRAYSYWLRIADGFNFFAPGYNFSRRFAYSRDLANWIYILANNPENATGEIFNLADENIISLYDFLKISADIMAKELKLLPADFAWLKENGFDLSASPYSSKRDYIIDNAKSKEVLNLQFTDIRTWLTESIDWFLSNYAGLKPINYSNRQKEIELAKLWIKERGENANK
jgi:nucleoside-diphosphate-sugar epimerase